MVYLTRDVPNGLREPFWGWGGPKFYAGSFFRGRGVAPNILKLGKILLARNFIDEKTAGIDRRRPGTEA
jgi:hypothetical protein